MLQVTECTPTPSSVIFTFELTFECFKEFGGASKPFSFPRGLWLFFGIGFHGTLLTHDGTTILKGKASCTKMGLARYDARKECGYICNDHG